MAGTTLDEVIKKLEALKQEAGTLSKQAYREEDSHYFDGKYVAYENALVLLGELKG